MLRQVTLQDLGQEPFRVFFPAGVIAGLIGVGLWPAYFWGFTEFYPGQTHPRLMACGLFGGFIFGFLGTAMPRMLSSRKFSFGEVGALFLLHTCMVAAFTMGKILAGNVLFLLLLAVFLICVAMRAPQRKDLPPPGFVLVALAFVCAATGTVLSIVENYRELDVFWISFHRLLSYQGFVLLPILGISPFLLPRFFGMESTHDFPEALVPGAAWRRKAVTAFTAGVIILGSFVGEALGWLRTAHAIRFLIVLTYLLREFPLHRAPKSSNALGLSLRIAFVGILAGFLTAAIWPAFRVSLIHLTLVGGFAVITFTVATRVVFGHSGHLALLQQRNRWLLMAIGLMLFGMSTRISADFLPKAMASHYVYGAILWIVGVLLWSAYVLPKIRLAEDE